MHFIVDFLQHCCVTCRCSRKTHFFLRTCIGRIHCLSSFNVFDACFPLIKTVGLASRLGNFACGVIMCPKPPLPNSHSCQKSEVLATDSSFMALCSPLFSVPLPRLVDPVFCSTTAAKKKSKRCSCCEGFTRTLRGLYND